MRKTGTKIESLIQTDNECHCIVFYQPPIAQLVERRTVECTVILRSLVRVRVGGVIFFHNLKISRIPKCIKANNIQRSIIHII